MVVFPALSRPRTRIRASLSPNKLAKSLDTNIPIVSASVAQKVPKMAQNERGKIRHLPQLLCFRCDASFQDSRPSERVPRARSLCLLLRRRRRRSRGRIRVCVHVSLQTPRSTNWAQESFPLSTFSHCWSYLWLQFPVSGLQARFGLWHVVNSVDICYSICICVIPCPGNVVELSDLSRSRCCGQHGCYWERWRELGFFVGPLIGSTGSQWMSDGKGFLRRRSIGTHIRICAYFNIQCFFFLFVYFNFGFVRTNLWVTMQPEILIKDSFMICGSSLCRS